MRRPGKFHGFRRHVIEQSPLRIFPYLNVSLPGVFAVSAAVAVGECADLHLTARTADAGRAGRVSHSFPTPGVPQDAVPTAS